MAENEVVVTLEFTPNPNTLKFVVNRDLLSKGTANFTSKDKTEKSPLAQKLFGIEGVAGVMIGRNFVTVTKAESGDWDIVHEQSRETLQKHLESKSVVVDEASFFQPSSTSGTDIEKRIKEILDQEIRPAVAMDGGDIVFDKFEDGVVYLFMQGACAGCPSSTMTLKMGIETRLREAIPEIREVVSV